ncbi:MAG TPA: hypothetical protein PKK43_05620 [Spirochaetota bacterium]|nr:hypothetical protein [Spirochaetota bacterium]
MNLKSVLFSFIFAFTSNCVYADDLRVDIPLEKAAIDSAGVYIAYPLTDTDEIRENRTEDGHRFKYEYRTWIVTEVILDKIGIRKGDEVRIAEPYQKMEYERARLYREKRIDKGLIENFYTSETSEYPIKKNHPVIVFVVGNNSGDLVFTALGARESVKSAERIRTVLRKKESR